MKTLILTAASLAILASAAVTDAEAGSRRTDRVSVSTAKLVQMARRATPRASLGGLKARSRGRQQIVTTHHCCTAKGCTGPLPTNTDCGGALTVDCQHTIEVDGKEVGIPPLCTPQP